LIKSFDAFNISLVPRSLNFDVDLLANVASRIIPSENLLPDTFSMELLYRPSIPDNVTNWRVFDDDKKIISFLHLEDTFKDSIIEEYQHDRELNADVPGSINQSIEKNKPSQINNIPKSVIRLEKLYDLQDKFKKVTNCKTNNSSMQFEVINLGSEKIPQTINLGKKCSPEERQAFIKLFKEYKDIFSWTYDDLKTYDTNIIQHVIPMKPQTKPFQQKLRKMHPSLEPQVKVELNKLLATRIIFQSGTHNGS
jgi:hypothetical protein